MRETIYRFVWDNWHMFWYRLLYHQVRVGGGYRKQINRFTGEHKVYKLHPLARAGVVFPEDQIKLINKLFVDERIVDAQQLVFDEIRKEMDFDGLPEAFLAAAKAIEAQSGETLEAIVAKEIDAWNGAKH